MSGTHKETPGNGAQTEQDSRAARPPFSWCVRPDRTARHERGSAPRRVPASGEPGGRGVTASSRSALLFRLSTTAAVAGQRALQVALQQPVRLVLAVGELQGIRELRLVLAGLEAPADAPQPVPQQQQADHQVEHREADEYAGGLRRTVVACAWSARASFTSFRISRSRCALTGW